MAALDTIRTKFGIVISVIIGLSLLLFILDNDTLMKLFSGDTAKAHRVAVIDGQNVTIEEFQSRIDGLKNIYGGSGNADQEKAIRDEVWQSYINQYLFVKNAEKAGIRVGVEELKDLTSGDNMSPIISQSFPDKSQIESFISQNPEGWDYLIDLVRNQQYYDKYFALFVNSSYVNPLMLTRAIEENNTTADVDFVMVPFGYVRDTTVEVSSSEIKKYYKDHKKMFRQNESRDVEYVLIEVVPSASDIAAAEEDFNRLYEEFSETDNVKGFLLRNSSEQSFDGYWYKEGELNTISRDINSFAFEGKGGVSPIYRSGDAFLAARVMDSAKRPETVTVKVIPMPEGQSEINSDVLAQLDATETVDMTQTYTIPGCEPLFSTPVNKAVKLESPQYGTLVGKVISSSEPVLMKQVAIFKKSAIASKETFSNFYSQANLVSSRSNGKYENFKTVCDTMGLYIHPANRISRTDEKFGVVDNAREVTNWAYGVKKTGSVSEIITVNQKYFFVAALTGIHEEGYAPIEEVSSQISELLYSQKAGDKKLEEISQKIEGKSSLEEIADVLGTTVSNSASIAFSSLNSQGLDPAFIGAVAAAEENVVSAPVKGSYGVYVFRVNSRDTGSFYTEDDAKANNVRMMQYSLQTIVPVMMDDADVKDNRARFF